MATYRCPAHDVTFETITDSRPPGSQAKGHLAAHPRINGQPGHPDCEKCQNDLATQRSARPVTTGATAARTQTF